MGRSSFDPVASTRKAWNAGRTVGAKRALKPSQVWAIRFWLDHEGRLRDRALFDLAFDSKLRGCDVVKVKIGDLVSGGHVRARAIVIQRKTKKPVHFELMEAARASLLAWLERRGGTVDDYAFPSRIDQTTHLSTRQYARLVDEWVSAAGLRKDDYGTHSLRRTKASIIYKATGNLRAVQIRAGREARDGRTMSGRDDERRGRSVPSGRLSRLGQFGRLAGGLAGGMLAEGARRLADGERPRMGDMLLTPDNLLRVADRLSHLRGAAMKLGQMISLDAGDALPAELSHIMARLRADADPMLPAQLERVLAAEWGREWRVRFERFEDRPIAAASIGQVHRAVTRDGRELAIKIQYPGVRGSIDADVDNVATLLRVSGLLPPWLAIAPLLAEAKAQLHEETDYRREGAQMEAYRALLAGSEAFVVPELAADFTTDNVLAMSFVEGVPIEDRGHAPQAERDRIATFLIALVLDELFRFGTMQTDPNFANFRYQPATGRIVLLDFGATRAVSPATARAYRTLLAAGLAGNREAVKQAAVVAGFVGEAALRRHDPLIGRMIDLIIAETSREGPFDFADRRFLQIVREQAASVASDRAAWHIPPTDTLFVQRKISGMALLAARLKARVDVRPMVAARIGMDPGDG